MPLSAPASPLTGRACCGLRALGDRRPAGCRAALRRARGVARAGVEEAANFVPVDESDGGLGSASRFGPDVLLLAGFSVAEHQQLRALLDGLGAAFVRTVVVSERLARGTLREALSFEGAAEAPSRDTPRVLLLSGMSSAEAMQLIEAIEELELPPPIMFAAAVPPSMDKPLGPLFEEIAGDHERLAGA